MKYAVHRCPDWDYGEVAPGDDVCLCPAREENSGVELVGWLPLFFGHHVPVFVGDNCPAHLLAQYQAPFFPTLWNPGMIYCSPDGLDDIVILHEWQHALDAVRPWYHWRYFWNADQRSLYKLTRAIVRCLKHVPSEVYPVNLRIMKESLVDAHGLPEKHIEQFMERAYESLDAIKPREHVPPKLKWKRH